MNNIFDTHAHYDDEAFLEDRNDLLRLSPLAPILNQKPHPFAFPNGVFKEKRLQVLIIALKIN